MLNPFEEIYANNSWGHGSGEGSLPIHTKGYVKFLERFILNNKIQSIADIGCGDWQFSKSVDWHGAKYDGYDVVRPVVEENSRAYAGGNVRFHHYFGDFNEIPSADLLIAKDVLQHLPDETIIDFLGHLSRFKFALLTNCINPRGPTINKNIPLAGFRYLDLRLPPFNLQAVEVFSFTKNESFLRRMLHGPSWRKVVLLCRG